MAIGNKDSWLPAAGDSLWSHPNHGREIRVETDGCETRLVFVASSPQAATKLADDLLVQIKRGSVKINIGGKISRITDTGEIKG